MKIHRFFVEEKLNNKKEFETSNVEFIHQWKNVFRLKVGDKVILLDNSGFEFYGTISLLSKNKAIIFIDEIKENIKPKKLKEYEVHLYISLIKKNNFELVLEKGTELGVTCFIPIISDRSENKNFNMERAQKIIKEASEQSERGFLPTLENVTNLNNQLLSDKDISFFAFHLFGEKYNSNNFMNKKKIGIIVGPEGGWTDRELDFFKTKKIPIISLGSQTLRSETASIAVSSLLLL
ncbi:MAG: 16S rRNA (uracil(1498)-N(3))-methyltransferase [Patescibacteria group bacterium]|nr:16S rRNA (uracil(1498)-N(3))-methyltransferase [Patescibacteria group bacterium]